MICQLNIGHKLFLYLIMTHSYKFGSMSLGHEIFVEAYMHKISHKIFLDPSLTCIYKMGRIKIGNTFFEDPSMTYITHRYLNNMKSGHKMPPAGLELA